MHKQNPNGRLDAAHTNAAQNAIAPFRLIPATFTPMHTDGAIDHDSIERYATDIGTSGIADIFVNGTTGESLSLTTEERLRLVETWSRHRGGLNMIVHVGDNCQQRSVKMASHAEANGASGIACMAPTFFQPAGIEVLLEFLSPIAAAAPSTKFYYYHIPSMTRMTLRMADFIALAVERIPNFAGVKYTHEDLEEFGHCQAVWGGRIELFFGRDELLLPGLSLGANAAVGSFYSVLPGPFQNLVESYQQSDQATATENSRLANRYIDFFKQVGVLPGGKFILAQRGIGSGMLRLPLQPLSDTHGNWLLQHLSTLETNNQSARRNTSSPATKSRVPFSQK